LNSRFKEKNSFYIRKCSLLKKDANPQDAG